MHQLRDGDVHDLQGRNAVRRMRVGKIFDQQQLHDMYQLHSGAVQLSDCCDFMCELHGRTIRQLHGTDHLPPVRTGHVRSPLRPFDLFAMCIGDVRERYGPDDVLRMSDPQQHVGVGQPSTEQLLV